MKHYDCIVLGFGGVGSLALRFAALNGWKVLGIDRFGPAHDRGSSHGQTRVIRKAYFEHPDYVPLLHEAFELWDELNRRHRTAPEVTQLIERTGVLNVGQPDSEVIRGVRQSVDQHDLVHETFTAQEIQRRLPIFRVPEGWIGIFEQDGGFLRVEQCVAASIRQALQHGAEIQSNTIVEDWRVQSDDSIAVRTDNGTYYGDRLIVAAGAWSGQVLPIIGSPLTLFKKQQQWFQLDRVDQKRINGMPIFLFDEPDGDCFYGVPEIDYLGLKLCRHSGGQSITDPTNIDRSLDADELNSVESFMDRRMIFGRRRLVHHSICLYTMSADGHFLVDQVPEHPNVVFATGLSGHGFKLVPVIGKYLVELLQGNRRPEFDFLRLR